MSVIGGPCYCVMFGAGPPAPHQTAALARWKRTTLAYMGARSQQKAARELGVRFVGAHTRAVYSRLTTGDTCSLSVGEAKGAFEWGDWGALEPHIWRGPVRVPNGPERDMLFPSDSMRDWPYRFTAAMASIYGWEALTNTGLFLDADLEGWCVPLCQFAEIAKKEGIKVYLNGGRFRNHPLDELLRFDGLFYEAVHVGKPYEAVSLENAEVLLERLKKPGFWVGVQVRFLNTPSVDELTQWGKWFLKARKTKDQTVTFVVQPDRMQPIELHCPDVLDPAYYVQAGSSRSRAIRSSSAGQADGGRP